MYLLYLMYFSNISFPVRKGSRIYNSQFFIGRRQGVVYWVTHLVYSVAKSDSLLSESPYSRMLEMDPLIS